jgi:hypothetical protein
MRSVTVRIYAGEFSATIAAITKWLHVKQYEPTRYKYEEHEDTVLVTVDFASEMEAEAFATRCDGVYDLSPQWISPEGDRIGL